MGNQAGSDMVAGTPAPAPVAAGEAAHVHTAFHGRPSSWVAVTLIVSGFLCGGLSLVFATWPTFWVGAGLAVIGGLLATMTDIFEDWY